MGRLTSYYSNSVAITAITRSDQGNSDSNCISRAIIATANANSARSTLAQPPKGGCCNAYATPAGAHSPERGLRAQPRRRAGNERGLDGADEGGAGDGGVDESASEGGASEGSADECSAEQDGAGEEGAGEGGAGAVTLDREHRTRTTTTRAMKAEATTAVDVTTEASADTNAVGSTAADSVGSAETTNEAAEAAENSACGARHGQSGAHVTCCQVGEGERAAGSRGQTPIANGAAVNLQSPAARSCGSFWLREELDVQKRLCRRCCRRRHACGRARQLSECVRGAGAGG